MKSEVRAARGADLDAIEAVDRSLGQESYDRARVLRAIEEGRVAVAEADGEFAGYVRWGWFWEKLPYCMIARVRPQSQRRGTGRALYDFIEQDLRGRGHTFWLSSTEADNEGSLRFHAALGFRQIGTLSELGRPQDEVFLRKELG